MPDMPTLEEARQERERTLRILMNTRVQYKALGDACPKTADGRPDPTPELNTQLLDFEKQCVNLKATLAGQEQMVRQMENAAELANLQGSPGNPRPMFPGSGGQGGDPLDDRGYNPAHKALTIGNALAQCDEVKGWQKRSRNYASVDVDLNNFRNAWKAPVLTTGLTGYERPPGVVGQLQQGLTVADLMSTGTTDKTTVRYLRETTRTHSVGNVAENAAKPEQPFGFEEIDAPVKKIAGYLKMSDELMNDYPAVRSFIDSQLPFEVKFREEQQLLNGTGLTNQITGVLQTAGIQTQALAADKPLDAIFKAMMKIMSIAHMEPDGLVINPANWQTIRLVKETTEGYIWGHPSVVGPVTVFGIPVVITTAAAAGTGVVAAWKRSTQIFFREGVRIEMSNSDGNDFIENRVTVLGEERLALAVYYPAGICTVTGLT